MFDEVCTMVLGSSTTIPEQMFRIFMFAMFLSFIGTIFKAIANGGRV